MFKEGAKQISRKELVLKIIQRSKIIFLISHMKTYVVTHHQNRLDETVLMMGHKICFNGEIRIIFLNYPCYPFLSGALAKTHLSLINRG